MDEYLIFVPEIKEAFFSKNPCGTEESVIIYVSVSEKQVILTPEYKYSGEIYSNEV